MPKKAIEKYTGLKRNLNIRNYQISHVFGRRKNPLAFTAPWNIIYIPKVFDPFTGHESKGKLTKEFTIQMKQLVFEKYKDLITEYNDIIQEKHFYKCIEKYFKHLRINNEYTEKQVIQFERDIFNQFNAIKV